MKIAIVLASYIFATCDAFTAIRICRNANNIDSLKFASSSKGCDSSNVPSEIFCTFSPDPLVSISGPPLDTELTDENVVRIVLEKCTDYEANVLAWKCLGYRYDEKSGEWNSEGVFPKWRARHPNPVDLIGITRTYGQEVDKPVKSASVELIRSIPHNYKGKGVRSLRDVGFKGYKLNELTPNKTRRAQLVNWLLYYRESFYNKTFEEILAERVPPKKLSMDDEGVVASEYWYEKLRLDMRIDE
mmetsp:Transcript_17923/g.17993  ORF Transcript_17923/g.17993 Transcript_17923/m.17993 type:complete len:244 (+) Transcript_17923:26-757(+)|eukprot:CAMPEP_0182422534 /NCGR_PEP_ID=MMETSP1167-20130531/8271_1 /TAXON_ID=2988 /ORGANISM="Mallomonas Sp, Strain CCMP3275" /LENGTH=243 /DNA_ID=CAMNT_0024600687 /DNA_START=14 /DNA_END=745 /DNA_ORIENTATION=-